MKADEKNDIYSWFSCTHGIKINGYIFTAMWQNETILQLKLHKYNQMREITNGQ